MNIDKLNDLLSNELCQFVCQKIDAEENISETRIVNFFHKHTPPLTGSELKKLHVEYKNIDDLLNFYKWYGEVDLYVDVVSGDTAYHIAHPEMWNTLKANFYDWVNALLTEEEKASELPDWANDFIVFGEKPRSSNCFLMPISGPESGSVYEFEHDGFEIVKISAGFNEFISDICTMNESLMANIASQMRFINSDPASQWRIVEYHNS